ncbi:TPA: hypothetical protein EYP66_18320 [Candidatus Poribacteria bacterium]|nr:hypothetical protein [Candidatus Poribacteria bacterium]
MKNIIYVDDSIIPLVHALNQVKEVKTVASCEGHDGEDAYIALCCSINAAIILAKWNQRHTVLRRRGLLLILSVDLENPEIVWGYLKMRNASSELQELLIESLRQDGLLTEACSFEILPKSEAPFEVRFSPNFSANLAYMTTEKLQALKSFAVTQWHRRLEGFLASGWEDDRCRRFPYLEGNTYCGFFYYENLEQLPAIDIWQISWQAWVITMTLDLHEYGQVRITKPQDLQGKRFRHDDIIQMLLSKGGGDEKENSG